jgi:hypothetical protein
MLALTYMGKQAGRGGLLVTIKAAPIMLSVRHLTDPLSLDAAFEGFYRWGAVRGACQVLLFPVELWALLLLARPKARGVEGQATGGDARADRRGIPPSRQREGHR